MSLFLPLQEPSDAVGKPSSPWHERRLQLWFRLLGYDLHLYLGGSHLAVPRKIQGMVSRVHVNIRRWGAIRRGAVKEDVGWGVCAADGPHGQSTARARCG